MPEVGFDGQEKISQAKVMVIGAGGLGCPVLQYLAGMGVGKLGIADADTVHMSNLHRQTLYSEANIGTLKVNVASQRLKSLNSQVNVHVIAERITTNNIAEHCSGYDVIVDCTDNYESRKTLANFCASTNTLLVFGAVQQFEGMVSVFGNGFTFSDLFPEEPIDDSLSCAQEGILGHVAGHVACLMVNEVVKIILGLEGVLSGKVLAMNLKTGVQRIFHFHKIKVN